MKKLVLSALLILSCSFRQEIQRSSKEQLTALQSAIDKLILDVDPNVHVGIEVVSVKTGKKIYQKNANQLFIPASSLKLFTGAAALYQLGNDFQFETQILSDGKIKDGVLEGNLYLKGSGNPEFTLENLEELVFSLKLAQIDEVTGSVIADNTDFDGIVQGPGWLWDEEAEYWNSPMDALVVNHSCLNLWVKPAEKASKPPLVYVYPKTPFVTIQNTATTVEKTGELKVGRKPSSKENLIEICGSLQMNQCAKEYQVPLESPHLYSIHLLKDLLTKFGIRFNGYLTARGTPAKASLIATHRSQPLGILVQKMMKESDNLAADCIFKKLGQKRYGSPGSWQNGGQSVREFLTQKVGLDVENMVMFDGCGLSRYNLVSPHQVVSLLSWMQKQFKCSAEFMASLPIAGVDGTLKNRMTNLQHNVRAKTGGMSGVSSLSGYLTTKDGDLLAFSIITNGFVKPSIDYKYQLEDKICTLLAEFSYH